MTLAAGLADVHVFVVDVAHLANGGNEIYPAYSASVIGNGVNIKTGEPIEFYTRQTGL